MTEVLKTVVERLSASRNGALVHPDANLLSALAEQALTGREQDDILAHLGVCPACREVLALSSVAPVPAAAPRAEALRNAHRNWWKLLWATPVIVVLAAVAALLLQPGIFLRSPRRSVQTAQNPPASLGTAMARNEQKEVASPVPQRVPAAHSRHEVARSPEKSTVAVNAPAQKPIEERIQIASSRETPTSSELPLKASASSPAASTPALAMNSQATPLAAQQNNSRPAVSSSEQPAQAASNGNSLAFSNPKPALGNTRTMRSAPPLGLSFSQAKNHSSSEPSDSFVNSGAAPVTASAAGNAFSSGGFRHPDGFSLHIPTTPYQQVFWSISPDGKLLRKGIQDSTPQQVQIPLPAAKVRTVTSQGTDVWVGGAGASNESSGVLLHSNDSGAHWQQIAGPWMGAIVGLQMTTTQSPAITLRTTMETWESPDSGITWSRLR